MTIQEEWNPNETKIVLDFNRFDTKNRDNEGLIIMNDIQFKKVRVYATNN